MPVRGYDPHLHIIRKMGSQAAEIALSPVAQGKGENLLDLGIFWRGEAQSQVKLGQNLADEAAEEGQPLGCKDPVDKKVMGILREADELAPEGIPSGHTIIILFVLFELPMTSPSTLSSKN